MNMILFKIASDNKVHFLINKAFSVIMKNMMLLHQKAIKFIDFGHYTSEEPNI